MELPTAWDMTDPSEEVVFILYTCAFSDYNEYQAKRVYPKINIQNKIEILNYSEIENELEIIINKYINLRSWTPDNLGKGILLYKEQFERRYPKIAKFIYTYTDNWTNAPGVKTMKIATELTQAISNSMTNLEKLIDQHFQYTYKIGGEKYLKGKKEFESL